MDEKFRKIIGYMMFVLALIAGVIIFMQIFSNDIWYDEVFSLCFAKEKVKDLIALAARDVHPPFYYLYLKAVSVIMLFLTGSENFIFAAKASSFLPWCVLFVISITYIRKKWGIFTAGLYIFLITVMPQIGNYYIEIRMYSLAILLITLSGLLMISILEKDSAWKWLFFCIVGVMGAYTQYYSAIGIVGIYFTFIGLILLKKDLESKKKLKSLVNCILASIALYIPWIPIFIKQVTTVGKSYWIQPLTIRSLAGCIKYVVLPVSGDGIIRYISAAFVLLAVLLLLTINIKNGELKRNIDIFLAGIIPLMLVMATGFIFSILKKPIFVYRYMIPQMGLMWLAVAILLAKTVEKYKYALALAFPFILCGFLSMRGFYYEENNKVTHVKETLEAFKQLPKDAVVITNFDHVTAVAAFYLPESDTYLYGWDLDNLLKDMLNIKGSELTDADVKKLVKGEKPVYFFGSFNSREEILSEWKKYNIIWTEENSLLMERYWFNIYRLGLDTTNEKLQSN